MQTPSPPQTNDAAAASRRKGFSARSWLAISSNQTQYLQDVGKHTIMRRTGLPARDLRILDPMLSYPSMILGREKAIVINLEHIKAVITKSEILVPNSTSPFIGPFVADLQARVSVSEETTATRKMGKEARDAFERSHESRFDIGKNEQAKAVPFEFEALEICLESACKWLESETLTLEKEAYPAMDELTSKICNLSLERVRQIKSRLVALTGRVQKVRDELEHLLDDDMHMAEMYLTEKFTSNQVESSFTKDPENDDSYMDGKWEEEMKDESASSHVSYSGSKPSDDELEMLLDACFVQIDGILNKLSTVREYVDDREDCINKMLGDKRNQLLQMLVMLNAFELVISAGVKVTGLLGKYIGIELFNHPPTPYSKFRETTFGTVAGIVVIYALAIGWGKKSGLLR